MNFRRGRSGPEEPEINLIPFIDVLLVVIIFLMLTTTYSRYSELQINLPVAAAEQLKDRPGEVLVSVSADGRYTINRQPVDGRNIETLAAALRSAAGADGAQAIVIVSADALAAHQSVIGVLDAARRAGLPRLTFATQLPADGGAR
ncbi:ExbD/TolR family protein [Aquabacterium sp. OR-4]|uniref:ExbD/TolR family protein n=1 Tax=Aquabacterium sp. OR-4 TaxID=2978127 RepID=UPI0021B4536D|nr:biopolymer transporter ExbD [Aquabacterium sp. OR-4]MDT7835321.1 biopolymer transporter ExbD [Aquabacterium sp. OR-4]